VENENCASSNQTNNSYEYFLQKTKEAHRMSKFRLFIATSIDGYIAREDGSIDWLDNIDHPKDVDYGYSAFMSEVDTIIMGRKTYEDVVGFDVDWPYADYTCYVISSNKGLQISTPSTEVVSSISDIDVQKMKQHAKKDIWIVGGGVLIANFLNKGLIDSMLISIIPVVLGNGRPLFKEGKETMFKLSSTESFESGVVNLTYTK